MDKIPETCDYLVVGLVFSLLVSTIPGIFRLYWSMDKLEAADSLITRGEQIQHAHKLMFGHHWRYVFIWRTVYFGIISV